MSSPRQGASEREADRADGRGNEEAPAVTGGFTAGAV